MNYAKLFSSCGFDYKLNEALISSLRVSFFIALVVSFFDFELIYKKTDELLKNKILCLYDS